jgi:Na+-translocating ferredoxin:NAD+ oxidoreductase RnfA subunit
MGDFTVLIISSIFINNIILAQYLGACPFVGTSKKMETAIGMAGAVVFVLTMAGIITWVINTLFPRLAEHRVLADHRLYHGDRFPGPVC